MAATVATSEAVRKSAALYPLVERAAPILDDVLAGSRERIRATWDRAKSGDGDDVLTLTLSDAAGQTTWVWSPAAFADAHVLRFGLLGQMDSVLANRIRLLVQKIESNPAA